MAYRIPRKLKVMKMGSVKARKVIRQLEAMREEAIRHGWLDYAQALAREINDLRRLYGVWD